MGRGGLGKNDFSLTSYSKFLVVCVSVIMGVGLFFLLFSQSTLLIMEFLLFLCEFYSYKVKIENSVLVNLKS